MSLLILMVIVKIAYCLLKWHNRHSQRFQKSISNNVFKHLIRFLIQNKIFYNFFYNKINKSIYPLNFQIFITIFKFYKPRVMMLDDIIADETYENIKRRVMGREC